MKGMIERYAYMLRKRYFPYISFSKNVFLPLTTYCRNKCLYCGFTRKKYIMTQEQVEKILNEGKKNGAKEALFTFGEKPDVYDEVQRFLDREGYADFKEYHLEMCKVAIEHEMIPHSNPGVMDRKYIRKLKDVNGSLGLMLETTSMKVEKDAHRLSPGKRAHIRIRCIEDAGKEKVPFTTGILLGIGESFKDVVESISIIRDLHRKYGHIQEVIVQNFIAHKGTPWEKRKEPSFEYMKKVVMVARVMMKEISIQVPPNLTKWWELIKIGANDIGGISDVTIDFINPEHSWQKIEEIAEIINRYGEKLKERLAIYPKFIKMGWYSQNISSLVEEMVDEEGWVVEL